MDLQVAEKWFDAIPVDSVAAVSAENVLGTKYINIKKGRTVATIQPGAEIKSLDTREFDDVVQQGYSTLASLNGIFKKLDTTEAVSHLSEALDKILTADPDIRDVRWSSEHEK